VADGDTDNDGVCNVNEVPGCTDATACNFSASATDENGSCTYPPTYYTCSGACVNDADGDGVCNELEIGGCTDATACNYAAGATDNDGSCVYPPAYYTCGGACVNDTDGDGVCNELEIPGCTNAAACNYNPSATDDNGSCAVPTGCEFCNGTAVADGDADNDGVCDADEVVGCQDATACNYLATATDAGECDFCSCQGNTTNIAGYDVVIEPVAVHTTGALAGKTTYRLYLETPNTNDVVTAFIGDDEFALNVTPALVGVDPLLAYDSYVTIGLTGPANTAAGEYGIMPIPPGATSAWATNFAAGGNIAISDAIGSGWYTLPSAANAVSGADHRVLFAQLTTDGKISGSGLPGRSGCERRPGGYHLPQRGLWMYGCHGVQLRSECRLPRSRILCLRIPGMYGCFCVQLQCTCKRGQRLLHLRCRRLRLRWRVPCGCRRRRRVQRIRNRRLHGRYGVQLRR
jgi:hypothetical protein